MNVRITKSASLLIGSVVGITETGASAGTSTRPEEVSTFWSVSGVASAAPKISNISLFTKSIVSNRRSASNAVRDSPKNAVY